MRKKELFKGLALLLMITSITSFSFNAVPVYGEAKIPITEKAVSEESERVYGQESDGTPIRTATPSQAESIREEENTVPEDVILEENVSISDPVSDKGTESEESGTAQEKAGTKQEAIRWMRARTATPSQAETEDTTIAVVNPQWDEENPGYITWDGLPEEQQGEAKGVLIKIYKDDQYVDRLNIHGHVTQHNINSLMSQYGAGLYTFKAVWRLVDDLDIDTVADDQWSVLSSEFEYVAKEQKAVTVSGAQWDEKGHITWTGGDIDDMPGYTGQVQYICYVYEDGQQVDYYITRSKTLTNITGNMKVGKTYMVAIITGGDGIKYDNSEPFETTTFLMNASKEASQGKMDAIFSISQGGKTQDIVEGVEITDDERNVMKTLLQTNKETEAQYIRLEESYRNATGITFKVQAEDNIIDAAGVSVAGGAINGASGIEFIPAQKADTSLSDYNKKVTMDISLNTNTLKFPVLITMPAPGGMDAKKVRIYHYHDGGDKEVITPSVVSENGTEKLRFAVSDFSIFTFVELNSSTNGTGNGSSNNRVSYGSSSSDDGGVVKVNKNDPNDAPTLMGTWIKDEKGWWFKKTDRTYPKNQWAKINNALYRFDEAGYMAEGWVYLDKKWYYLKPQSGDMAKGWILDKGKWYYMNQRGVMATGWVLLSDKWYYLGKDGAMYANTTTPDNYRVDENGVWIK